MDKDKLSVRELTDYVVKRVNENASATLTDIDEDAWRSHARDVVEGVMRSCAERPEMGVRVVCDDSNNPQYNIDNNILSIDVIINDPTVLRKLCIGNDNAKTSVCVLVQKEENATDQKDI